LDLDVLTGLSAGQRILLVARCSGLSGEVAKVGGRPPAVGLYGSVMMVVCLMRKNITQEMAGAVFGVSQSTVSRRWDRFRPVIKRAVASFIPHPREVLGCGTALVDGTITPTWDWKHVPDLFSAKAGYAGMNVQIASSMQGRIAAVGPVAVHGARHDAHAFEASGLKQIMAGISAIGDLGYVGVDGVGIVPIKRTPKTELRACDKQFNTGIAKIRALNEQAVAHFKSWRMMSEEGGRCRIPIHKFEETLQAITGLMFFRSFA
jgi:DDE superfamily endonuclease